MPHLQSHYESKRRFQVHSKFRLFLTSLPTNVLPPSLLKLSLKATTEQPAVSKERNFQGLRRRRLATVVAFS